MPNKLNVDKKLIADLAALLEKTGLSEIEWSEGGVQVRVARGGQTVAVQAPAQVAIAQADPAPAPSLQEDLAKHPGAVKSPMVGTAYHAPEPGASPFVRVGDTVSQGQTVMIVEAMKTMNPIPAPKGGRVKQILVGNQEPVEYGQVLLVLE
ncbi:MAG: acetyl-CoA carboxylase biotin carboxyl carrier protein [Alphaproteobacteria bacterium]|nr:acetyl-CoA carboxylase biotin carboxyl carrier protein [Alphaproteobacteria bacterium]